MIHEILTIFNIGNAICVHRNRIGKFLVKYRTGRIIGGIVILPFLLYLGYKYYKLEQDPELIRLRAKANSQKKISDFC